MTDEKPPVIIGDDDTEYTDNIPSRLLYWISQTFTPSWCAHPNHWTVRLMDYLWTDCPCCLFYRGTAVGVVATLFASLVLHAAWFAVTYW